MSVERYQLLPRHNAVVDAQPTVLSGLDLSGCRWTDDGAATNSRASRACSNCSLFLYLLQFIHACTSTRRGQRPPPCLHV
jgi:hypothetical protein